MDEYIEREATLHRMKVDIAPPFKVVSEMQAADVAPVVHGSWGNYEPDLDGYRCSCCKLVHRTCTTYCPNCGAKIDLEG